MSKDDLSLAAQQAAQYRAMFDDNPRAMLVYEHATLQIMAANQAATRTYGYTVDELTTMRIVDFWVPPEDGDGPRTFAEAEARSRSVPREGPTEIIRRSHRRKDGSRIEVELSGNGLIFEGKAARLVHILDVTRRVLAEREVTRLARAQRMLSACNEALIRATDERQLLDRICQIAVDIGGYLLAWVGFAEDDAYKTIRPAAWAGENGPLVTQQRATWSPDVPAGNNSAAHAIRSGRIGVIADVHTAAHFPQWSKFAEAVGHKGIVGLPLRQKARVFGAMVLYAPVALHISPQELELLEELANDVAFGIDNLRALDQQRRLQAAVLMVGSAVSRLDGDKFFVHLIRSLLEAVGAQGGHVGRLLPGRPGMGHTLAAMMDGKPVPDFDFKVADTPAANYREQDAWLMVDDVTERHPRSPMLARMAANSVAVRRLDDFEGKPIGFLSILFRERLGATQIDFVDSMLRIFAARAASELERQQSDARIRSQASLLDKAQDAISVRDLHHRVIAWNQGCERVYGWRADEVIGKLIPTLIYGNADAFLARHEQLLRDGTWSGEVVHHRRDGTPVHVESRWTLVRNDHGEPESVLAINTDITRRKAAEEAVHKLAFYDSLTGLPNRQLFNVTLRNARTASSESGLAGALLFVNLDNFKSVNETLGHVKGDLLLKLASERIVQAVTAGDTVARIGGDEFLVLLQPSHPQIDAALTHAADVSQRILRAFATPIPLEDFEHLSTVCIGIAAFIGDEVEDGELLKQVDLALYQAKAVGRGVVRFYDPRLQLAVAERTMLETELRQALGNSEMELYYQPQIHRDGHFMGVEALLRWKHPRRGMVSPAMFIPVAEESGLILSIGQWVIESACKQLAAWHSRPELAHLSLSVNVSASQFRHEDFVDQVVASVRAHHVPAGRLKLELTESLLVYDMEAIIEKMQVLKSHGLGLSLDDFGTGYSSLSYLKRMPLDQLKIDQAFVRDVMTDPNDAAIARTVIGLGHSLGLVIIAEGVEQIEQRDFLFDSDCDAYQGYLMSRPLPLKELEAFLAARSGHAEKPQAPRDDVAPPQSASDYTATLHAITEAIPAMIAVNGPDERYRFVNRTFERWFGKSSAEIIGRTSLQVLGPDEYNRSSAWIRRVERGETVSFEKAFVNRSPVVHIAISFIPLRSPTGQYDGYVTVAQDVTHHREETSRLAQLSERDPLTGLLNRRGFEGYMAQEVSAGGADRLGLLYVDLDHFKPVNDQHGHWVGDLLLREFAQRLRQAVRPNDAVARLGGDEFAVVLARVPSQEQCIAVADKILAAARAPFEVNELHLRVSASVGIAFNAGDDEGLVGLIKRADAMLYQAKAAGRGRWV